MKSIKLDILLENSNPLCKYHLRDSGEAFCERAWANTDREVLKYVHCEGQILRCELKAGDILRRVK